MVHSSVMLFSTFSFLLVVVTRVEHTAASTKVSIYYESLCIDCIVFIKEQLYPSYKYLKDKIIVDYIPYGKANQSRNEDGTWVFTCQHGIAECRGNKYQACALDTKKGQDDDTKFVNCVMSQPNPSDPDSIKDCATSNGYNWRAISQCYEGNRGNELLAAYGDRTHSLKPKLRFVPAIVFDDTFNQTLQNESVNDFLKAACSKIAQPKPSICTGVISISPATAFISSSAATAVMSSSAASVNPIGLRKWHKHN